MPSLGEGDMSLDFDCSSSITAEMFLAFFAQGEKFGDSGYRLLVKRRIFSLKCLQLPWQVVQECINSSNSTCILSAKFSSPYSRPSSTSDIFLGFFLAGKWLLEGRAILKKVGSEAILNFLAIFQQ